MARPHPVLMRRGAATVESAPQADAPKKATRKTRSLFDDDSPIIRCSMQRLELPGGEVRWKPDFTWVGDTHGVVLLSNDLLWASHGGGLRLEDGGRIVGLPWPLRVVGFSLETGVYMAVRTDHLFPWWLWHTVRLAARRHTLRLLIRLVLLAQKLRLCRVNPIYRFPHGVVWFWQNWRKKQ